MRRPSVLRPAWLAALATVVCVPAVGMLPAAADATDGTLTVTVAVDQNGSGAYEPKTDGRQAGVRVTVTDAGGQAVSGVTDESGQVEIEPTSKLSGGRYFVTAELPEELELRPAPPSDGFAPFSSTVDVSTESQSVVLGVVPRRTAEPTPSEPTPDEPSPDEPSPDEPSPDEPSPDEPSPDEPTPDEPTPDEPTPDEPTPSEPTSEGPTPQGPVEEPSDAPTPEGPTPQSPTPESPAPESPAPESPTPESPTPVAPTPTASATTPAVVAPPRFAVGDRVWQDRDGAGRQDDAEPGLPGISVQLLDGDGTVLASTTSDDEGRYLFDDLPAGAYAVRFAGLRSGFKLTSSGDGSEAQDSDPDYTGVTPPFSLGLGEPDVRPTNEGDDSRADYINANIDAGVAPVTYAIASVVWQDENADGLLDQTETPGAARVVLLRGSRGDEVVASTTTDDQGRYRFVGLPEGSYRVRFADLGNHRRLTRPRAGTSKAVNSAPNPESATSDPVELVRSSTDLMPGSDLGIDADFVLVGLNAGTVGSYTITNRVWRDLNEDGLVTSGEPGVEGVPVELLDARGAVVATTTTVASGRYTFARLPAGNYQLRFPALPTGLHFTAPSTGADSAADSDVYGNALTAPIAVGEENPVETQVAAGLSTSAVAAAGTVAPGLASATASSVTDPRAAVVDDEGAPLLPSLVAFGLAGLLLAAAGSAAVAYARVRRTR